MGILYVQSGYLYYAKYKESTSDNEGIVEFTKIKFNKGTISEEKTDITEEVIITQ